MPLAVALAFPDAVLSGAAALVYEVVWLRMLGLIVGHAVDALTAVLAAFMAGLALGALFALGSAHELERSEVQYWIAMGCLRRVASSDALPHFE